MGFFSDMGWVVGKVIAAPLKVVKKTVETIVDEVTDED